MLESTHYQDPLDALRRFVPTPLSARLRVGRATVVVTTNDLSLVPDLPGETASEKITKPIFDWKLVRDDDAPGALQKPLQLSSWPLTVVTMGTACLLGVDHERGELLCFIGADIDAQTFQDVLVPMLCKLSLNDIESEALEFGDWYKENLNDA